MSPRKPVKALYDLSLDIVIRCLRKYLERKVQKINFFNDFDTAAQEFLLKCRDGREFLDENFLGPLRWKILDYFLSTSLENVVRVAAFLLLQDPRQSHLSFGHFPALCFPLLASLVSRQTGLESLSLRNVWLEGKHLNQVVASLDTMPQLTQLIVPYIATDCLVAAVGAHCPRLELLDITGTELVTDSGVVGLVRETVGGEICPTNLTNTLRFLLVGGPGGRRLSPKTVGNLLVKLPGIISLGSFPHTREAVSEAVKRTGGRRGRDSTFQLRYFHDLNTTEENFEDVTRFCSELRTIFLDNPEERVLSMLDKFQHLRKLKLNKVRFEQLLETTKLLRPQITMIELVAAHGTLDLGQLSEDCPNLTVLEIFYSKSVISLGSVKFNRLKKCVIYCTDLSGPAACDLMENCPNIEHFNLSSASTLTPASLQRTVLAGQLDRLEELALMSAPLLDISSLELLVETLPALKLVGRLEGWNLSADIVEQFRKKIRKLNYDLTLWYNLPLHLEMDFDEDLLAL